MFLLRQVLSLYVSLVHADFTSLGYECLHPICQSSDHAFLADKAVMVHGVVGSLVQEVLAAQCHASLCQTRRHFQQHQGIF